jgi:hypothetical protein
LAGQNCRFQFWLVRIEYKPDLIFGTGIRLYFFKEPNWVQFQCLWEKRNKLEPGLTRSKLEVTHRFWSRLERSAPEPDLRFFKKWGKNCQISIFGFQCAAKNIN